MAFITMNRKLSTLVLTSHMLMALSATNDSFLILSYGGVDIHFDMDTFGRFYKCLCNSVMSQCNASTMSWTRNNIAQIHATNITDFYNNGSTCSGAKQCRIDKEYNSQLPYTISCLCTDGKNKVCHYKMSLLSQPDDNNMCMSSFVEIGLVQGDSNIIMKPVDGGTLQIEKCRKDSPAACKNVTELPIGLMSHSNIYYVLISSNCCFILLVILLATILIYKTKGTNKCCMKETNVRVNEDGHCRKCTVYCCNQPTVCECENLECENHFSNSCIKSDPVYSFQQCWQAEEENFQESCGAASLNINTLSDEETHQLRNTLVKSNSFVEKCLHSPEHSPDREDIMSTGDFKASMNGLDVNNTRAALNVHDNNTDDQRRNTSKTTLKPCVRIPSTTTDNEGYIIVDISDDVPSAYKVKRNTNGSLPTIQEINNEVSTKHTSKGITSPKCKPNETILERALAQMPEWQNQMYENDGTIKSPTSLCGGYEVPIVKDGPCHTAHACENGTQRNASAKTTITPVGSLDDGNEVAMVNSRPVAKSFSGISKPEIVFLPSPCPTDMRIHERNNQSLCDKSQTVFDRTTREVNLTENNESGGRSIIHGVTGSVNK